MTSEAVISLVLFPSTYLQMLLSLSTPLQSHFSYISSLLFLFFSFACFLVFPFILLVFILL